MKCVGGTLHSTVDVIGGGIRGACEGDRDEDGERYRGSSCSGARGSSNESRNLDGDMEPSTELSSDMLDNANAVVGGKFKEGLESYRGYKSLEVSRWNVVQVSSRSVGK